MCIVIVTAHWNYDRPIPFLEAVLLAVHYPKCDFSDVLKEISFVANVIYKETLIFVIHHNGQMRVMI